MTRTVRLLQLAAVTVPASLLLSAAAVAGLWVEIEVRERRLCEQGNEGRGELRHALADVLTENLVEAARTPPDPAVVDAYSQGLLADLETEFPNKDCG